MGNGTASAPKHPSPTSSESQVLVMRFFQPPLFHWPVDALPIGPVANRLPIIAIKLPLWIGSNPGYHLRPSVSYDSSEGVGCLPARLCVVLVSVTAKLMRSV